MPEVYRTPEDKFKDLLDYPFGPNWFDWKGVEI
jgi:hypothetical protein